MSRRTHTISDILIALHFLLYGIYAIYVLGVGIVLVDVPIYSSTYVIVTVWTLLLFLHVRSYYFFKQHASEARYAPASPQDMRRSYREGYNDALEMLHNRQEIPDHLALDDDGELIEEPAQEKRKYR